MNAIIREILQQVADFHDSSDDYQTRFLATYCRDDHGALLGVHYNPVRLALDLMDGVQVLDLSNDEAGGAIPVPTSAISHVHTVQV